MSRRAPRPRPKPVRRTPDACPCGLPASYDDCCGALHRGEGRAAAPERLMRSRFSAFAVGDEAYLLRSWHPSTRPSALDPGSGPRWLRLEILGSTGGSAFHDEGTVEFRAHYSEGGRPGAMRENSRFVRLDGAWVYLDGVVSES